MSNTTDKICSKCGAHLVRRENVMTTSEPALYIYDCPNCGGVEYDIHMYPCGDDACHLVLSETVDYKKLYEDALERARQIRDGKGEWRYSDLVEITPALTEIFPGLAESEDEDERIRKFLIDRLSCGIWKEEWPFSPPECVAYLEKQKDSIPYAKYVEDIAAIHAEARAKYHAGWNDGYEAKQKGPQLTEEVKEWKKDLDRLLRERYGQNPKVATATLDSEKQKEQQPVENPFDANETMTMKDRIDEGFTKMMMQGQKPELVQHPPITYTYPSDASRDEQLKMALLALLNSDLIKVAGNKFTKQDLIDWVEKQKPAEWSEEDEKMLNKLINRLNTVQLLARTDSTSLNFSFFQEIGWLKSLKNRGNFPKSNTNSPIWKPSEEQMNSLNYGIYVLEEEGYDASASEIKELYEQLKKLM